MTKRISDNELSDEDWEKLPIYYCISAKGTRIKVRGEDNAKIIAKGGGRYSLRRLW